VIRYFSVVVKREREKLKPCCVIYASDDVRWWTLVFCCLLFVIYLSYIYIIYVCSQRVVVQYWIPHVHTKYVYMDKNIMLNGGRRDVF